MADFFVGFWQKKRAVILWVFLLIAAGLAGFYFWQKGTLAPAPSFSQTYRLVPEKVSQSAMVQINLPPNVDPAIAKNNLKFDPEIPGEWRSASQPGVVLAAENSNTIFFDPREKLNLNRYYAVELALNGEQSLKSDFLAVEDPEIIAIFPKKDSETPEDSEITIVFNRPMVPLTTLAQLEGKDVPVEISPKTEGRFKWISTRNLQFIPEKRLVRSANYKVSIKSGLSSVEGLSVKGAETSFTTRHLRYLTLTEGQLAYNEPISIYFNQPVNLNKTKGEISVIDNSTGKEVSVVVQYSSQAVQEMGEKKGFISGLLARLGIRLSSEAEKVSERDQSILQIFNQRDRFGRAKFWDFERNYTLKINKAYPLEGDIILDEGRQISISVPNIIKNLSAESERTRYATANFFDPQGKLLIDFYEEINLDKSRISASKLKEMGYGEKCRDENLQAYAFATCEKIPDQKRVYLIFKSEEIGLAENLEINLEKIVNLDGININKDPLKINVVSYPSFKIVSTSPAENSSQASLQEFVFCSNSPVFRPDKEEWKNVFRANPDYQVNSWGSSYRVDSVYAGEECGAGEFHTSISYGLMPETFYSLTFDLTDVFGQRLNYGTKFTTGPMPDQSLSFYHLQGGYNVTTPDKTRLTFGEANMEYVNLEICKLAPLNFLSHLIDRPRFTEKIGLVDCQSFVQDRIELPKKYWLTNYFKVDLRDYFSDPLGHYVLTFSHPNYLTYTYDDFGRRNKNPAYEKSFLTVTNLGVTEKKIQPATFVGSSSGPLSEAQSADLTNLYWVTNLGDLNPVSQAQIQLYRSENLIPAGLSLTNNQGVAETPIVPELRGVVVSNGRDSTVLPIYSSSLNYAGDAYSAQRFYLYTDKPIYRPGQEVFIKGIYRIGYDGNYEIFRDKTVNLKIFNSRFDEISNQELQVNEFGTFNTKFVLDSAAPLGNWRFCIGEFGSCEFFDVQEYVPAAFNVEVRSDKEEYVSKDKAVLEIDANYYFGVPLESGDVEYAVSTQNYYFDKYSDGYFNFGSPSYFSSPFAYGDRFISRGKTSLRSDGYARIEETLDLEKMFGNEENRKSKIVVFDITVRNSQGQSVSSQKSFILHAGGFYLGLNADKSFLGKNEKINLKVKSVDTQGKETKVRNIELALYKIDWVYAKRQEATGGYSYKWEKKRELVEKHDFDTDSEGNYIQELKIAKEGEYEAEVKAKDQRGNSVWSTYNLYVFGEGQVSIRPTTGTQLEITAEKIDLKVGEDGKILIKSPYNKAKALISIERGRIFDYQIREINGNLSEFVFPAKSEYLPNVFVSVLLQAPNPEVKFGQVEFKINTKEKELDIAVKANKTAYLPGEEVILDILIRDSAGRPVSAETSLAVVDVSVLALKGNPKKNPIAFFYGGFPLTVQTSSNVRNILVETEVPTKGGGGGEGLAKKARGLFKETALWQAQVRTDSAGRAQVKFILPDNLTTWQTETIGLTRDTKLGVNYQEFLTRKELMIVPLKPRFVVPGDAFSVGAQIFNQSQRDQRLEINFASESLELNQDSGRKNVAVGRGDTETVYFKVRAPNLPESGQHGFSLSAKAGDLEDTVLQSVKITANNTYETVSTANYTQDAVSREYVFLPDNVLRDQGGLTIKSSATLALFLSNALNYLLQFPYGCSEQIASQLNAIAVIKKGLNLPNLADKFQLEKIKFREKEYTAEEVVELSLPKLYNNQNSDGGFSYWGGDESNFYLTLQVVESLNNLSLAKFPINQNSLNRAASYLQSEISKGKTQFESELDYKNRLVVTAYTLSRLPGFQLGILNPAVFNLVNDNLFLKDQISNSSLAYLAILLRRAGFAEDLQSRISDLLDNRINIDGRGAFLEPNQNLLWAYYETPIKDTALYLKALAQSRSANPILDKVLRWLLNSRAKDGAWGSTNNTLNVIDALTDFLVWKRETESDFTLDLLINREEKSSFQFQAETILNQPKTDLPLSDLKFGQTNIVEFQKTNHNNLANAYYYDLALKYYLPADNIAPRDEGFSINRAFYALDDKENKNPVKTAKVGDVLRVHWQIVSPKTRNFVAVEDFIPAGMEIINLDLATEQKSLVLQEKELEENGRELAPNFKELRDDRAFAFQERMDPGVYEFDYFVRVLNRGKFALLPAQVSEMYFPENFGRTAGEYFEVK